MQDPVFLHRDLRIELAAVNTLTQGLVDPVAQDALSTLLTRLRLAADTARTFNLATGNLPWVSRPLATDATALSYGGTLTALAGDVLEVHADWRLEPCPRSLRDKRDMWICPQAETRVVVRRDEAVVGTLRVPLFPKGVVTQSAVAAPATIACVVEAVAEIASPALFRSALSTYDSELKEWNELHLDRASRLAEWQIDKARSSRGAGRDVHSWVLPNDLFVRPPKATTRPKGRVSA